MTTKPRARKFRLRRGDGSAAAAGGATGTDMPFSDGATDDDASEIALEERRCVAERSGDIEASFGFAEHGD